MRDFLFKALPELQRTKTYPLPRVPLDDALRTRLARPAEALQAYFVGHASFLVQAAGYNFLTDPVFSQRASPVQWFGPARYTQPAVPAPQDLPLPVHFVLISHNHYDHVDSGSVHALLQKEKDDLRRATEDRAAGGGGAHPGSRPFHGTAWVAPLRVRGLLQRLGVPAEKIVELDWWDEYTPSALAAADGAQLVQAAAGSTARVAGSAPRWDGPAAGKVAAEGAAKGAVDPTPSGHAELPTVVCVPAQHQSARFPWDQNRTLWCGYVVRVPLPPAAAAGAAASDSPRDVRFYFSGDTGYRSIAKGVEPLSAEEDAAPRCPAFREIGQRYGPIDLALLPIGAYSPRWFMSSFHASPEDAVEMHRDVRARRSVGMHWGTFPLTDEPIDEPPRRLARALTHKGVPQEDFLAVNVGSLVGAKSGAADVESMVAPPQRELLNKC
jgi:N-acyl-phosphatidylethanolamine-hydrolysing phospholipase D